MKEYTGEKPPYNKEDLLRHLATLQPRGFVLNIRDADFIKKEEQRTLELTIGSTNSFPHFVKFSGVSVRIKFSQIEQIYNHILKDHSLGRGKGETYTINSSMTNDWTLEQRQYLSQNFVEDDADFELIKPILEDQVQLGLNWFDQFTTLEQVHEHAMNLSGPKMAAFIAQPLPMRFAIIKKLVNAPDYETYINSVIDYYTNDTNAANQQKTAYFNALKAYLETI